MNKFKLEIEALKKTARFQLNMPLEQSNALAAQLEPMAETLSNLKQRVQAIRADNRLSDSGKAGDVAQAKSDAAQQVNAIAQQISRQAVIADLAQRVNTRLTGSRERARQAMGTDAALLAQELRLHVIPRLLADAKQQHIPAQQALGNFIQQAAERFSLDPVKAEIVIQSAATGWPWVAIDVEPETMTRVNEIIARQVAAEEQAALEQAQAVQGLIGRVTETALQSVREQA